MLEDNFPGPVLSLHNCFVLSFASAFFGFSLGVFSQRMSPFFTSSCRTITSRLSQMRSKNANDECSEAGETILSPFGSKKNCLRASERRKAKPDPDIALSELHHCLIEARGEELEIITIDRNFGRLFGCTENERNDFLLPKTVHDLLPIDLRAHHRSSVAKAVNDGELPFSLMHPMRNIPMLRYDGSIMHVDLCIGAITKVQLSNCLRL